MFLDDQSIKSDHQVNLFSSTLKQNIIYQAASMLLQHVTFQKNFYHLTQNNNSNALDERRHFRRTNKCNSWLAKFPDTSLNRLPVFLPSSCSPMRSRRFLSSNASSNINSQPLMLIHKKRLRRDYFLSTMHNCIQPPYSQNHFYAFDQFNLLKLQRKNSFNLKRKYSDDDEQEYISQEIDLYQTPSSSKRPRNSPPKTADHISINKYHEPESEIILSRLEKILNLCGELRTLANEVENHLHEKQTNLIDKIESEQAVIDIYEELEIQEVINELDEKNASLPYEIINDTSSIHSESNKSLPLMQTESFKTKSNSETVLRKPEDICSCFLKSIFEKDNCQLNSDEQEYLNQLTKAYLLGREQILKEQHEQSNKFQLFLDEKLPDELNQFDTNNNNQSHITPVNPSSNFEQSNHSIMSLNEQQSTISSEMITAKHQVFITEPIAMKTTNVLPGIGVKYAQQLADCGFSTVRRLLGFYLMIKNDQNFVDWLNTRVQISIHSAWLCTKALRTWCQIHSC